MTLIRTFKEKDRKKVTQLWDICGLIRSWNDPNKDLDRKQRLGKDLFLILELENDIIGTAMGGYDGHRGVMNYLAIHPGFRGNGFGKLLVKEVEKRLVEKGCPKVNLLVRSDNAEVGSFYESINYEKQEDVFIFGKRLIHDN